MSWSAARVLIVNADDFGQSPGVNRGVIEAHERGIVTSASLMVRWPAAVEAAASSRNHPSLSIGLHFDLGEWAFREETWSRVYEVVPPEDVELVADELTRQLTQFRSLLGRDPTHIDSHQHVHNSEPVRSLLTEAARKLAIPLRGCSPQIRYCGNFYGQTGKGSPLPEAITVDALVGILSALPAGVTELGCHPGSGEDLDTMYSIERAEEVRVLCDPRIRAALVTQEIELRSFSNLSAAS